MAEEKKNETSEVDETETEGVDTNEAGSDDDGASWAQMKDLVDNAIAEGLNKWQREREATSRKRMTSSSSQRKEAKKRKQGIFSQGFFSGLAEDE